MQLNKTVFHDAQLPDKNSKNLLEAVILGYFTPTAIIEINRAIWD